MPDATLATAALELSATARFEEHHCPLKILYSGDYRMVIDELGPTDAGLLHLAKTNGWTILSGDKGLKSRAAADKVRVLSLEDLEPAEL